MHCVAVFLYVVHALCGSILVCSALCGSITDVPLPSTDRDLAAHVGASTEGLWSGQWASRWTAVIPVPYR